MTRRIVTALMLACISQGSMALDWRSPWVPPQDSRAVAANADEYAWRLFVALDWPADPIGRTADPGRRFGSDRPVVWETWQDTVDIYRPDGADPGPWRAGRAAPTRPQAVPAGQRFESLSPLDLPNARHIVRGVMVPLESPIIDPSRLTEIRINRAAFEYLRSRELYNLDGQWRAVAATGAHVAFPAGAIEVKAKWRPIRDDEAARYHTVRVALADGSERLYGLTALHIVSKVLPTWFWATFEHVDNPALGDGDGWRLPSRDRFGCRGSAPDCNRPPRGIGLEGTVWQAYRLRGTLTQYEDAAGRPLRLANSELEAGFQTSSSCITCHARAALARVGDEFVRLPVFDTSTRPGDEPDDARPSQRRGFLGTPQPQWFTGAESGNGTRPSFRALDFVWSLAKAQPKRGSQ
jgi:hypothetical protein